MGNEQSLLTERGYRVQEAGNKRTGNVVLGNKDANKYSIKTINMTNMDNEIKQRTKSEVASLGEIDHPHIVHYVESFADENSNYYIVMDYYEGGDLSKKIKAQQAPFSENQIVDWFIQICLGLKCAHDRNMVHRNIKPQNIFLTKEETIKLGDFGVSKILSRVFVTPEIIQENMWHMAGYTLGGMPIAHNLCVKVRKGKEFNVKAKQFLLEFGKDEYAKTELGTPVYIAPELWKGKCFDNKSDIWALGCVLYELCTFEFALPLKENLLFLFELWSRPSPQISEKFSPELRHLVDELLQKDPARRPSIDGILKKAFIANRIPKEGGSVELQVPAVPFPLVDLATESIQTEDAPSSVNSDSNNQNMHCDTDQDMPLDRNLNNVITQLNQDIEAFKKLCDQDVDYIKYLVKKLETIADGLERVHFGTTIGSLTGGVAGAAGGVTSLVGLILAPFTLGASLIVTGVGTSVAVAGGVTSAVSNVANMRNESMDRKTIEKIISEYREKMEPILMSVEDIITGIHRVKEHESFTNVASMANVAFGTGRVLGGIPELVRLVQVLSIGKLAAHAARAVQVTQILTGMLTGFFLAINAYFIFKDSQEILSITEQRTKTKEATNTFKKTTGSMSTSQSRSQQRAEIKSATVKLVVSIREMTSHFKENLDQLESMREELKTKEG